MGLRISFLLAAVVLAACGASPSHQSGGVAGASAARESASPSPSPSTAPSVAEHAPSPAAPSRVFFFGLPAGDYVTHLHSACSGSQAFHITVLDTLEIAAAGTGSVAVPSSYFGRGLCVIVYANASLSRVLTTQRI